MTAGQTVTGTYRSVYKGKQRNKIGTNYLWVLKTKDLSFGLFRYTGLSLQCLIVPKEKSKLNRKETGSLVTPDLPPPASIIQAAINISNTNMGISAKKFKPSKHHFHFLKTRSCYVARLDFLTILLLLPPQYWDYRCSPSHTAR